jgi:DNA repair exonuclease SbcCD nuclease subunit
LQICLITDQHFGARNDSVNFLDYYEKFYRNIFFPTLKERKIKTVLILGDTFDRRKYVNFYTLKRAKEMFFDVLAQENIQVHMLAGNHDTYYKNTNEVNSVDLLLREYDNINVIDSPQTIHLDYQNQTDDILMIPWVCADNYDHCLGEIKNTSATLCAGHFEIQGFAMYRGAHSEEGLSQKLFQKFDMTFSGHYHHKSSQAGIHYLGNPYPLTWQDYGDPRGFHILDTKTRDLQFIHNPYEMFVRIVYDDKKNDITTIATQEFSEYTNKYIKVVVVNKTNPYLFDVFINNIYQAGPADVTIVEDFIDLTEGVGDDMIEQAEDTLTILNTYVDAVEHEHIDGNKLKTVLKELYVEALNLEQT